MGMTTNEDVFPFPISGGVGNEMEGVLTKTYSSLTSEGKILCIRPLSKV